MPYAVTHFLIPAILVALFRDFFANKKNFSLHYILIAGLGGLLMDCDYILYYLFRTSGMNFPSHRIFFHNLFFVLIFFILWLIFLNVKFRPLEKHKLKLSTIFFIVGFAGLTHIFLDWCLIGQVLFFYPVSNLSFGLNLLKILPLEIQNSIIPIIDAVLLAGWMIYLELRHKISDYI